MATPTNLPSAFVAGDILTAANMNLIRGGFRVLQVVTATTSTEKTHNTTSYTTTNLTASITPQFDTSTILVLAFVNGTVKGAENTANALNLEIVRGATQIQQVLSLHETNTSLLVVGTCFMQVMDTPATTSATTYTVNGKNSVNTSTVATQFQNTKSVILLAEISA